MLTNKLKFLNEYGIVKDTDGTINEVVKETLTTLKIEVDFEITKNNLYTKLLNELEYENISESGLYFFEEELNIEDFKLLIFSLLSAKIKNESLTFIEKLCYDGYFDEIIKSNPHHIIFDGMTLPVFKVDEKIFEKVYVETPLDTDQDGLRDLVEVYIKRPKYSCEEFKVPVIYIASPYSRGTTDELYKAHNVDFDLINYEHTNISYDEIKFVKEKLSLPNEREIESYGNAEAVNVDELNFLTPFYDYFLSRGFAIVVAGGVGTRGSQGIRNYGSIDDTISTISIIDWLNDRLNAFVDKNSNVAVKANWCSGKVGMTGKSYLGTLAVAAATTGVEGLETIVSEAAISNWYDYYRQNGLCVPALGWQGDDGDLLTEHCMSRYFDKDDYEEVAQLFEKQLKETVKLQQREYGNYNTFFDERNYLKDVDKVKASVFIVHGLNDFNVKPGQAIKFYNKLVVNNKNVKMILHRGEHIYIDNIPVFNYDSLMNKWFAHYLLGISNDVEKSENIYIQSNLNKDLIETGNCFPFETVTNHVLYCNGENSFTNEKSKTNMQKCFVDNLDATGFIREENNYEVWQKNVISLDGKNQDQRLVITSEELVEDTRYSGEIELVMNVKSSEDIGIISCMLVDYGVAERVNESVVEINDEYYKYGYNSSANKAMDFNVDSDKEFKIVTRGHMSMQNRNNNFNKDELKKNTFYEIKLKLEPSDYIFPKGNKIGLVIYATDPEQTNRGFKTIEYTIDMDEVKFTIPLDRQIV